VTVPVRVDLHVHSRHSPDSSVPIGAFVRALSSAGLNGLALTDHNTVAGHGELRALAQSYPGVLLIPGIEVSTVEGHLLVFGVDEAPPSPRSLSATLTWVEGHGGVAVPSHPFRWSHGIGRAAAESAPVHALEAINGHTSPRANSRAATVVARRHLGGTGGSDAHALSDLGRAFTEFPEDSRSVESLLVAIRRGQTRPGGSAAGFATRARLSSRSAFLRIRRGFRSI
jgi:predicted metal-dependent phosphoesterase TrpH